MSNGTPWAFVGFLGVLTGFLIMSYYAVVSGWCLQYIYASLTGHLHGDPQYVTNYFQNFSTNAVKPVFWTVIILAVTCYIIVKGVEKGIERASKLFMPTLFILLLVIVAASCMLPGAEKGIVFLFKPDFTKISKDVFLGALGQSFYSLSIAMGCLCTYASYFSRQTNLTQSAVHIGVIDSIVAILAGLMIFPAAFSVGITPDAGPSLIFITLPNVFNQAFAAMPIVGYVISLLFYGLLALAALTSLISLHEVSTAFLHEEMKISRRQAAIIITVSCIFLGTFCSLSLGGYDGLKLFGMSLFELFDFVTGQIMLPVGGFLTCLFVGWYVPRHIVREELPNGGELKGQFFNLFIFAVRYICPLFILLIFLHQFGII